jgi:acyl-CoA thioesterase FadM
VNLYLRLLRLWLQARRGPVEQRLNPSRLRLRVWPNDLDLFGHMNNGRYLTLMDLGRLHIVMKSGLLRVMRKRNWYAAVAAVEIRFRRPLRLWQRYTLITEIVDWDGTWFLFEQRFESAGKVYARALVQAQFRHQRERVSVVTVLESVGQQAERAPAAGRLLERFVSNVRHAEC